MSNVTISFLHIDDSVSEYTPMDFKFKRERYTPYTTLSGHLLTNDSITDVKTVFLYIDGKLVHAGMADMVERKKSKGRSIVSFLSRSFTLLLGQNEPVPGVISDVDLAQLIFYNTTLPYINCQADTQILNYVYVKEKSTIWDAVCAYAYKAYTNYPYIYGTNTVRATVPETVPLRDYNSEVITFYSDKISTSGLYSHVFMKSTGEDYPFTQVDNAAVARNIVRKKYYPLDPQWYADPDGGLLSKLKFSNRGFISISFQYKGFKFENLLDKVVFSNGSVNIDSEYVSAVEVTGNSRGIFTKISVYRDGYSV